MTTRSIVIILLCTIGLMPGAYGISVDGLKLDRLKEKLELRCTDAETLECKNLNDLFRNDIFQETTNEEVSVQLSALDEVSRELLVDTDDESSVQSGEESKIKTVDARLGKLGIVKRKMGQNRKLNRSRHVGKATNEGDYNPSNNYLLRRPNPVSNTGKSTSQSPTNVDKLSTRSLCNQLTSDAFLVSESGITDRPGSTTCFCVALRDKFGYIKKFVFHNGENLLASSMRTKARELGYDVIQAEQSHAEGQLIQFLLDRHQKRPGWYTHILGMGCSRSHCMECNPLLKLYLGKDYDQFTSSLNTKNKQEEYLEVDPPDTMKTCIREVNVTTRDTGELVVDKRIERTGTVVYGQDAVDERSFKKFYLPLALKDSIQDKLDISISFDKERFTKSKKRTQHPLNYPE